jgi:hypothetical protein
MIDSLYTDYIKIIAGTSNTISKAYTEAVKDSDPRNNKGMGYIKNFMSSIEKVSPTSLKDDKISRSKGNIDRCEINDNVRYGLDYLGKELRGNSTVNGLESIYNSIRKNKSLYTQGYDKHVRLIELEYESSIFLLITGITYVMAYNISLAPKDKSIRQPEHPSEKKGSIPHLIKVLARELDSLNHTKYLSDLLGGRDDKPIRESVIMEGVVADTVDLISSILTNVGKIGKFARSTFATFKRSLFGILPLIRSIMHIHYKKKADTILNLEEQIGYIKQNIEFLENNKSMKDSEKQVVIKKQQAVIAGYTKKAAKLRAELADSERVVTETIKDDNKDIQQDSSHDFVLESGMMEKIMNLGSDIT